MSDIASLSGTSHRRFEWSVFSLIVQFLFLLMFGAAAPLLAVAFTFNSFSMKRVNKKWRKFFLVIAMGWGGCMVVFLQAWVVSRWYPLISIPLAPIGLELWPGLQWGLHKLRPKTTNEQIDEEELNRVQHIEGFWQAWQKDLQTPPQTPWLCLGKIYQADYFPAYTGITTIDGWLCIDEDVLDKHVVIEGGTGAGKTVATIWLLNEILTKTTRDIFLIDGKGELNFAENMRALCAKHRGGEPPLFKFGHNQPGALFDAFQGESVPIYERLLALTHAAEATGNALHYALIKKELLQLVCGVGVFDIEPPRSIDEVLDRFDRRWLQQHYPHDLIESATIEQLSKDHIQDTARAIRNMRRLLRHSLSPEGFNFASTNAAIFSIRNFGGHDSASSLLNFIMNILKDYAGNRQTNEAVIVIEETESFNPHELGALCAQGRSMNMGMCFTSQDFTNLQSEKEMRTILANSSKIALRSDYPEHLSAMAGTKMQGETGIQQEFGEATAVGTTRKQHGKKISDNTRAQLPPGMGFFIKNRFQAQIQFPQMAIDYALESQRPEYLQYIRDNPIQVQGEIEIRKARDVPDL